MNIQVHSASMADLEDLQQFATSLFAEAPPGIYRRSAPTMQEEYDFIASRVTPKNSTLLIARLDGRVVGLLDFLGGTLAEEAHTGTFGISVDKAYRGLGIGTQLIEELMLWALASGIRRVEVRAWANNPRAIRLYESLGFNREGILRDAILTDGTYVDVVLLSYLLDASPRR